MPQSVILSLGSNHNREQNMAMAEAHLAALLSAVRFTRTLLTEPIGIASRAAFANAVATGETTLSYADLRRAVKAIEREAGRTAEGKALGVIPLDIDILQYGNTRYKPQDWQRQYNITLLSELT